MLGHARCLVDAGFANIKKRYMVTNCETLTQLGAVVDESAFCNTSVCYPAWTWRRWKPFLEENFKAVPGIMYVSARSEFGVILVSK